MWFWLQGKSQGLKMSMKQPSNTNGDRGVWRNDSLVFRFSVPQQPFSQTKRPALKTTELQGPPLSTFRTKTKQLKPLPVFILSVPRPNPSPVNKGSLYLFSTSNFSFTVLGTISGSCRSEASSTTGRVTAQASHNWISQAQPYFPFYSLSKHNLL